MTTATETDVRLDILNSLLTCPHRDIASIYKLHQDLSQRDPLFYGRLAAWYNDQGDVRDHQVAFASSLCLSSFDGHRDEGCALLREMPPYQVGRVVDFAQNVVHGRIEGVAAGVRRLPHSVVTEVTRYLREREGDDAWFDATALSARKVVKRLYATLHVKPCERAQKILFDREPPADSKLHQLKVLAKAETPAEQAAAIVENKIPYRIAATVVQQMTPAVLLALVEVMSPQELLNNIGALKKRGAMNVPEIKELIDGKVDKAKSAKNVAALKTDKAAAVAGLSEDEKKALEDVADAQVKAKGRITMDTALFVDKSYSMDRAIELGKRIAALVSTVMDAELFVYAFDTMPMPVKRFGDDLASWTKSFLGIRAMGGTSIGCPFTLLARENRVVEQVVIVSDGGENNHPLFVDAYRAYCDSFKIQPNVVFVHVPGDGDVLSPRLRGAGVSFDYWKIGETTDYYSLPGIIPLLSKSSKLDLLVEIMSWPIPARKAS